MKDALTPDEINPWHFPRADCAFARRPPRTQAGQARRRARACPCDAKRFDVVLVEGAGGLLSPLGGHLTHGDLIAALSATPMVVCPNRLGAVNQVLLTLAALPRSASCRAHVVMMSPSKPEAATNTNAGLLAEFFDAKRIFELPWLGRRPDAGKVLKDSRVRHMLRALVK